MKTLYNAIEFCGYIKKKQYVELKFNNLQINGSLYVKRNRQDKYSFILIINDEFIIVLLGKYKNELQCKGLRFFGMFDLNEPYIIRHFFKEHRIAQVFENYVMNGKGVIRFTKR